MISSYQRYSRDSHTPVSVEHASPLAFEGKAIPEPDVGPKWPIWKSAIVLVTICGSAWGFIGAALWLMLR